MSSFQKTLIKEVRNHKYTRVAGLVVVFLIVILVGRKVFFSSKNSPNTSAVAGATQTTGEKTIALDTTLEIPIGKSDKKIQYKITSAELRKDIILRGEKARAVDGRSFLIINLKLSNKHEQRVSLNTRDYIRLSVNGTEERLAPTIHNDSVEVQPISDQVVKIGFTVNDTDSQFKIFVGEVSKEKTEVDLTF